MKESPCTQSTTGSSCELQIGADNTQVAYHGMGRLVIGSDRVEAGC